MSQTLSPLFDVETKLREADLYFDVKTDVIYFLKSIEGKKIKFSTGVKRPNNRQARREANRILNIKLRAKKFKPTALIKDELKNWFVVKENEGLAYDTMNNIRRAKDQIEEFWGSKFPHEINTDNMPEWYAWWRENKPDIEMENAVKYMRNFSRYLASKLVDDKPLLPIVPTIADPNYKKTRRARKRKKARVITAPELKTIVSTAACEDDATAALIMYTMATRVAETLGMSFGSEIFLDLEPPRYAWSDGQNKADHVGWHSLHPILVPRLKRLRERRADEGTVRLFPQQRDNLAPLKEQMIDWDGWRKRADLGWHWTPHTFRHTCLSNLFNNPANPQGLILQLYRVSLAVAVESYIHPTEEGRSQLSNAIKVSL